ncbi:hypothetical protein CL656_03435 [bacterium]|nr:hypothetical protein [bacterium]|tara:strand:+ start:1996 stop:2796 length:801 start_codon:yes stop_codon:yes gene_type:complete
MSLKIQSLKIDSPQGWQTTSISDPEKQRFNGIIQKKIGIIIQLIHNSVQDEQGNIQFEYDSPLFCEMQGAISVPYFTDSSNNIHIGFVHIDRPVLNVNIDSYHTYLEKALKEEKPEILLEENIFGDNLTEIPRGMGEKIAGKIASSLKIATNEADEEMGIKTIQNIDLIGNTYWNTSFSPTKVPVYALEISSDIQDLKPQELEAISGIEFIEINKANQMILNGEILDSMSITAIKQLELFLDKKSKEKLDIPKNLWEFIISLNPFS